jgi:hypothetical protein
MKNILTIIAFSIILYSCNSQENEISKIKKSNNYVVVIDLSDRIIQRQDQVEIDTVAIRAMFENFENSVQQNLTVKSSDKFLLRIIPQIKSSLPVSFFENNLSIDMGKFNAAEKLHKLNAFKSNFSNHLKSLYQQAFLGNKSTDFAGVDIWQYFNDQINSDLDIEYNNQVLVITDGYFDFQDKQHGITDNHHSTITAPLISKMSGVQWKVKADSLDLGLIPVKLDIPATWQVCGIQSKFGDKDLLETQKLSYLWRKWLEASGAKKVNEPIINSSSLKIQSLIQKSFSF